MPLTDEDVRSLVDVVMQPDEVVYGVDKKSGNKIFYFFKKNLNGTYNIAEVYGGKRGNLTAKSYFNTKRTISQRVNDLKKSQTLTSVTEGASSSSGAKIPLLFETAIENDEKTGADGEVSTHSDATQANPTFSREDLGAVLSDAKIRKDAETAIRDGKIFDAAKKHFSENE